MFRPIFSHFKIIIRRMLRFLLEYYSIDIGNGNQDMVEMSWFCAIQEDYNAVNY